MASAGWRWSRRGGWGGRGAVWEGLFGEVWDFLVLRLGGELDKGVQMVECTFGEVCAQGNWAGQSKLPGASLLTNLLSKLLPRHLVSSQDTRVHLAAFCPEKTLEE